MASRLTPRLAVGAVLVILAVNFVGAMGLLWMRGSLPELDGDVTDLQGLAAPVSILRDPAGTVHIRAETPEDALFALGFAHAQDRLWQMEMTRRIGAGRVSELIGESGLRFDKMLRTLGLYRLAETNVERLRPDTRAQLDAYVAGVNAYLEHRSGPLPTEFVVAGIDPEPWRPADSLVWGRLMSLQLAGNWFSEILRARMLKAGITLDQIDTLYAALPGDGIALTTPNLAGVEAIGADRLADLRRTIPPALEPRLASNAWALAGAHTPSGKPVLAGDPHLGFQSPNMWYLARIEAPGFLRAGAFVPGVPALIIGHNGAVAWSFTTTHSDTQDLFVERLDPGDPTRYLTPGGNAEFQTRTETLLVDDETIEHAVRRTRHGPVVSDAMENAADAAAEGTVLALASPVLAEDDGTAQAIFDMGDAQTADAFIEAVKGFHSPQQNIVLADVTGRIATISAGRVPLRAGDQGFVPMPGWTEAHDWIGWAPFAALPRAIDPAGGVILNANERVVGADPELFISREFEAPFRARRIAELLQAGDGSPQAQATLQADDMSLFARAVVPIMIDLLPGPGAGLEAEAISRMAAWDGRMAPDRAEPLIFAAWIEALHDRLIDDELGALAKDYRRVRAGTVIRVLTGESAWCDDVGTGATETCSDAVHGALSDALTKGVRLLGNDLDAWRWGEVHQATFTHRIWGRIPVLKSILTMRTPTAGGDYTVARGSYRPGEDGFPHMHGAGMRVVYDLANLDQSRFTAALGPSGNLFSPYAHSWHDRWAANEGITLPPYPTVSHTLMLRP